MRVRVELLASAAGSGTVEVLGMWPGATAVSTKVSVVKGTTNVTLNIPAEQTAGVRLWHPHGHGGQPLYNITATYTPDGAATTEKGTLLSGHANAYAATTTRRIGFRHVALVTVNDTDPAVRASAQSNHSGTGQFTMFFRVNGAAVYVMSWFIDSS